MKYLKTYEDLSTTRIVISDIIEKIGKEQTAKYLDVLLKDKYVTFVDSYVAKNLASKKNRNSGTVSNIFYINTSGFLIARIDDDTYSDLIINRSIIECDEELNYDSADVMLNSIKYNL